MENLPQFNLVDILAMIYIVLGVVRGFLNGLSGELARLLSVVVAVAAGLHFYEPMGGYLLDHTRMGEWDPKAAYMVSFGVLLAGGWLAMRLLRVVLRHLMEFTFRGRIEKVGGALAGFLRYSVEAGAIILLLGLVPHEAMRKHFVDESFFGRPLALYVLPAYEKLAEKYPALRIPVRREAGDLEEEAVEAEPPAGEAPAEGGQGEP